MAIRTNDQAVRASVDASSSINMAPFIRRANALTDKVAAADTTSLLTSALLIEIETCLAAHFYARRDPQYRAKSTNRASAEFQGRSGMRLDGTDWGQDAIALDVTGYLDSLSRGRHKVGVTWLGKPRSEQTDYKDRN